MVHKKTTRYLSYCVELWSACVVSKHSALLSRARIDTMPCAAGDSCKLPHKALDSTSSSGHNCRGECGSLLHGVRGETDPESDREFHRICPSRGRRGRPRRPSRGQGQAQAWCCSRWHARDIADLGSHTKLLSRPT